MTRAMAEDANSDESVIESRRRATAAAYDALGLPVEVMPRHIAIIMDGNGRWAKSRGKPRMFGHDHGARNVRPIVTECARLELDALTLYSFSTENWSRPTEEVGFLMQLYAQYLAEERSVMMDNNVRFIQVGRREGLAGEVLEQLDITTEETKNNTGLTLALALNYGSRQEILDATRALAEKARQGEIEPSAIDEAMFESHLYTAGMPDPDLLIRTAGEMRISNYLLWQISYSELYVTDVCWPDFDLEQLRESIRAYVSRRRNFGHVPQG